MRLPFAREAIPFALPLALLALLFFAICWGKSGWITLAILFFVLYFFRDPIRVSPVGDDLIVSPADGKVCKIDTAYESPDHPEGSICISIFLSIFNVHIQRVPLSGKVVRKHYNKGKFLAAWDHKASLDNEQCIVALDTKVGKVAVKQIAGLIARRIITWINPGDEVQKGDRLGLIRFGSRVDLILPGSVKINCEVGDVVKGGESIMAKVEHKVKGDGNTE